MAIKPITVAQLSDRELKIEFRDLWVAGWNARACMPPRQLTNESLQRFSDIQKEMNRRNANVGSTSATEGQ